jgi:hypothetical protein
VPVLADMAEDTDPFNFPELPDEAAAALDQFLEAFYHHFQNHYGLQLYRWYHALDEREARHDPMPSRQSPLEDPPF